MGDLLGSKIVKGKWEILGIKIRQRILVWGFIGVLFTVAAPTFIWFWTPVNTYTFLLPSEFRVLSGALLAIALGFILGMAKKLGLQDS